MINDFTTIPLVSVIVPNYNHAPYLAQRIESVLNQTYQDFEVIILDDCSTDNSREVIEQYCNHPKVSHIEYNETNSGSTFKQWQKGITLAKGEWIWIAESDDWCEVSFLEEVIPRNTDPKDIVLSYCDSITVRGNKMSLISKVRQLSSVIDGKDLIKGNLSNFNMIFNASMCVFKKCIFHECSEYLNGYKLLGDWLFWIEIVAHGNVKISGKCLNYWRKYSGDVTGKSYDNGTHHWEYLRVQKFLLDKNFIGIPKYKMNIFKNYISIPEHVGSEPERKLLRSSYRNTLGNFFYHQYLLTLYRQKLILIKQLLSMEIKR